MKLQVFKRSADKKSETSKLRRAGHIPATIYQKGKNAENIAILSNEFAALLRQVQPGRLSTQIITLVDDKGNENRAILKEIQRNIVTYEIIHLDFEELNDKQTIGVKVPVECTGVADCVGVKLGGAVRQVIRYVKVRCLPKDIPTAFYVDVKNLNIGEARRLSELDIPNTVRPIADLNEVAVAIVKR